MAIMKRYRQVKDMRNLLKTIRGEAEQPVRIAVMSEPQVEHEVIRMMHGTSGNGVFYGVRSGGDNQDTQAQLKSSDLALVVIAPGDASKNLQEMVSGASQARRKLVVVTGRDIDDWLVGNLAEVFRVSGEDVLFVPLSDEEAVRRMLVPRIVGKLEDKEIALAAAAPLFKDEVAHRIISSTALQNAGIGALVFVPGADMPLMTLNQIKMIIRLAAVYNEELSLERVYEILAVVAGGFAFREVARQLLGFIPVAGWAVKGSVAYAGTVALGAAARKYFESRKGETLESLAPDKEDTGEGGKAEPLHKSRTELNP